MANSKLTMELVGVTSAAAGCSGQFSCSLRQKDAAVLEGSADGQQNSVYRANHNILASGALTLDFAVILNIVNEQFIAGAADVVALLIRNLSVADGGGGGTVTLAPGAVSGWVSWLQAGSVMVLPPGTAVQLDGLPAGAYPAGPATSQIDFAETGTVLAADLQIEMWARQ